MSFVYLSITKFFDKINNSIYTTLGHPALISALGYLSTTIYTHTCEYIKAKQIIYFILYLYLTDTFVSVLYCALLGGTFDKK